MQLTNAYLARVRNGGKVGRGYENGASFVAAISFDSNSHLVYIMLNLLGSFAINAIGMWAVGDLTQETRVTSDGLSCSAAEAEASCVNMPKVICDYMPRYPHEFKWVSTVLGNLQTTPAGASYALPHRKWYEHYLAGFAHRFNRSFDLRGLVARLIVDVARTKPIRGDCVRAHAEACF